MDNKEIEVIISDELKKELASLGIDADKETQQGIQMGLSDGPDQVSTGQRVTEWTAQQAMTVNQAKLIDANVSSFKFWQAPVSIAANEEQFALAA